MTIITLQSRRAFSPGRWLSRCLAMAGGVLCGVAGCAALIDQAVLTQADHDKYWGVHVMGIHRSAAGYILDFRFRILDAGKAAPLLDRNIKPALIVAKDKRVLRVPVTAKLGPLRQSATFAQENRTYFMLFANPGKQVQRGDKVAVVIGDFKAEHLTVH